MLCTSCTCGRAASSSRWATPRAWCARAFPPSGGMSNVGVLKRLGRPVLRALGLRPPAYRRGVRHGEVAMDDVEIHGLVRALRSITPPARCLVEIGSYCGGATGVVPRPAG